MESRPEMLMDIIERLGRIEDKVDVMVKLLTDVKAEEDEHEEEGRGFGRTGP